MTDFLQLWHSPTTIVFLLGAVAYAAWHRMMNAEVKFSWSAKVKPQEASMLEQAQIEAAAEERDRAYRDALAAKLAAEGKR